MSNFVNQVCKNHNYQPAFIHSDSNWDIHMNTEGKALSIPNVKGCDSSFYGDKYHIARLIDKGWFSVDGVTEHGLECMSGIYSRLHQDSNGNKFHITRFAN